MANSNLLFESIFKRKLSDDGTPEYLAKLTVEYPYFSPAQFYLMSLLENGTPAYQQQAAKTSVLFNNPYWLQFQLSNRLESSDETTDQFVINNILESSAIAPELIDVPLTVSGTDDNLSNDISTNTAGEPFAHAIGADDFKNQAPVGNNDIIEFRQPAAYNNDSITENRQELVPEQTDLHDPKEVPGESLHLKSIVAEPELPAVYLEPEIKTPVEKEFAGPEAADLPAEEETQEKVITPSHTHHFNNETTPLVNEAESEEEDTISGQELEPLHFRLNLDTGNTKEDSIIFEPLHTSDYFASLGIKLSGDVPAVDKLGKQLKSFTEWLKTMKKIHGNQLPLQSGQPDASIQELAEQSNKETGVVTEAMAAILLRQGKIDKAMEVYHKLSLLNPSKSAYFAAKIDQLKEH